MCLIAFLNNVLKTMNQLKKTHKTKLNQEIYCNSDGIMILTSNNRCAIMCALFEKAPNSETVGRLLGANYSSVKCFSKQEVEDLQQREKQLSHAVIFLSGHVSNLVIMSGCRLANCQLLLHT